MPQHRGLNLKKFVNAIDQQLLDRYFVKVIGAEELPRRILMNEDLTEQFLADPANAEVRALVLEQLQRVNDLATAGKSTLVWTYNRYGLSWGQNEAPANMALRLCVDHEEEFRHAYAWYTWYSCTSRMSEYRMPADDFELTEDRAGCFQRDVTDWFRALAKGDVTEVRFYEQDGVTVILVTHGSYITTIAAWEGDKVEVHCYRPAKEDILVYDPVHGVLRVKATLPKDRDQYVKCFAGQVLEDVALAEQARQEPTYSLEPIRAGEFSYEGDQGITKVVLLEAALQLAGRTNPKVHLKSDDLCQTLANELHGLSLGMGALTYVKLRFDLLVDGKEAHENVEISPPQRSDLSTRKHEKVIAAYLQQQGVKLI